MAKQLKRTSDEMEELSGVNDDFTSTEEERPQKKRKLSKKANDKAKDKTKDSSTNSNKEIKRLKSKHRELLKSGYRCVVGADEAGRGPLAGPVVISAAYVPIDICIEGITDSKKINQESEREKLYEIITATKEIKYSVVVLDHDVIDEYNILEASLMGMRQCVQKLHDDLITQGEKGVDYALVDGNRDPLIEYPEGVKYEYITRGDGNVYCIAAASIIAKVTRDRIMIEYDKKYPGFKFAQNKGYPTPAHKQLVWSKEPCDIHRKTFRPVKDWYKQHKPDIHKQVEALKKQRAEKRKKEKAEKKKGKKDRKQKDITHFFKKK